MSAVCLSFVLVHLRIHIRYKYVILILHDFTVHSYLFRRGPCGYIIYMFVKYVCESESRLCIAYEALTKLHWNCFRLPILKIIYYVIRYPIKLTVSYTLCSYFRLCVLLFSISNRIRRYNK